MSQVQSIDSLMTADIPDHRETSEDILSIYRRCSSFRTKWKHEWPSHNSLDQILTHSSRTSWGFLNCQLTAHPSGPTVSRRIGLEGNVDTCSQHQGLQTNNCSKIKKNEGKAGHNQMTMIAYSST